MLGLIFFAASHTILSLVFVFMAVKMFDFRITHLSHVVVVTV
jgi:hypothetical protein